jgi:hypothetical protein
MTVEIYPTIEGKGKMKGMEGGINSKRHKAGVK